MPRAVRHTVYPRYPIVETLILGRDVGYVVDEKEETLDSPWDIGVWLITLAHIVLCHTRFGKNTKMLRN